MSYYKAKIPAGERRAILLEVVELYDEVDITKPQPYVIEMNKELTRRGNVAKWYNNLFLRNDLKILEAQGDLVRDGNVFKRAPE